MSQNTQQCAPSNVTQPQVLDVSSHGPRTHTLSRGRQDGRRHLGPHQCSCLMAIPAQLGKGISTNLKTVPFSGTPQSGQAAQSGKGGSHSLIS